MEQKLSLFYQFDIILVCGLPGSGKSHFAKSYFNKDGRKRVNRNEIRKALYEMSNFGDSWREEYFNEKDESLVKHIERKSIEHILFHKNKVLIDNTSVSMMSRKSYLSMAKELNKTIGLIFINTPLHKCIERNNSRPEHLSADIINKLYASIQPPSKLEGFKEIFIIDNY